MGNKSPKGKPSTKSQANQVLDSGEVEGTGGGAGGGGPKTLKIRLVKLQLAVVSQAQEGDSVEVQWQGTEYEVFRAGQLIGTVPGNHKQHLAPPMSHSATILELTQVPANVVIEVTL